MQLVILAAGRGRRLIPLTDHTPKCMVEVNGVPIIKNTLDLMTKYKLSRIVIVTGHLRDKIGKLLGKSYNGVPICYVHNPDYLKTNNIYSLYCAREYLDRETILMECDLFFDKVIAKKLVSSVHKNVVFVDRFLPFMDGTVVSVTPKMEIARIIPGKDQGLGFNYEDKFKTVNIYCFSEKYLQKVFCPTLVHYIEMLGHNQYYELILGSLVYMGDNELRAESVEGARWTEIDDFIDLERAEITFAKKGQLFNKVNKIHGGYWRYDFKDFSYLYNSYFPNPELINELNLNIKDLLGNYPSGLNEIIKILSNLVQVESSCLAIGNGASELISILKRKVVKKITLSIPTFNEYHTRLSKGQLNYIPADTKTFTIDLDKYVESVKASKSNVAVIINPDLPTGGLLKAKHIRYLLKKLSYLDAFILDESFMDFAAEKEQSSFLKEIDKFANLVIIKSLSKELGVPGLRLGYAASANKEIIKVFREEVPIWNINSLAEHFLSILSKYRSEYSDSLLKMREDRKYFYGELVKIPGIKPFASQANYIFVKLTQGIKSTALKKYLFVHHNILIKDCSNKLGLEDKSYVRLAVKPKEEVDCLVLALKAAMKNIRK